VNATLTAGNVYNLRHSEEKSNLTMSGAYQFLLQQTPPSFQKMLESNFSFGIEMDPERLRANDQDFRKWTNPLEVQLPKSKNLKIFCLYGVGKPTEVGNISLASEHGNLVLDEGMHFSLFFLFAEK
jgi:phospholipid:diacylglycerol acyltransferase